MNETKKRRTFYISAGVLVAALLASTITMTVLYITKEAPTQPAPEVTYTVTYSSDNTTIYTEQVKEGGNVINIPDVPSKTGYSGAWNHDGKNITSNLIIYALYSANEYTLSFNNSNVTPTETLPTKLLGGQSVEIIFEADQGYKLPLEIKVDNCDYSWNSKFGILRLSNPTNNVNVRINADYLPQKLTGYTGTASKTSYVQIGNNDKVYFNAGEYGQGLETTVLPGEKIYVWSSYATGIHVKKTSIFTGESEYIYDTTGDWEQEMKNELFAEFGYTYNIDLSPEPI